MAREMLGQIENAEQAAHSAGQTPHARLRGPAGADMHAPDQRGAELASGIGGTRAKLAVGIATAGRAAVLAQMLRRLQLQTRTPDRIFVCGASKADLAGIDQESPNITLLTGPRGSSHQRNAILRHAEGFDLIVFFDDDFVPCADYLEHFDRIMGSHPDVAMTTGCVLKDGVLGPGLAFEVADSILKQAALDPTIGGLEPVYNGYGCNMGMRLSLVRRHGLAFDERLPLYGWLEDVDFSQRLARFGRVVRSDATRGVHLGTKLGRQPGTRLGYSQIANPVYLIRKGTMTRRRALRLMSRNLAANLSRCLRPEPWVDRRGRLNGNLRALADLALGRLDPTRATSL
jgi:GT2 family glycosyltransferase